MVDKKTGIKPKRAISNKQKAINKKEISKEKKVTSKSQKIETSKKELAKSKIEETVAGPSEVEPAEPMATAKAGNASIGSARPAKAGRHSAKALAEAQAEQARQERIKAGEASKDKPREAKKPPRSRVERAGKKYREAAKLIDKDKGYPITNALELAIKTSTVKFDATVELHVNLGVDPKVADQNVRDNITLPAGTGKSLRIAVFAEGDEVSKAKAVGADIAGDAELLAQLDNEEINFDILITSPRMMARLGKYAKLLGPKGLMPNPKSGTITSDIPKAIKEAKAGRVEYRVDSAGIIHLGIGKVSFGADRLQQNADVVLASIRAAKPASLKDVYIKSAFVTTTMGPSIKITL